MTDNLVKILSEIPKVKRVFRKANDIDGFSVELENAEIIDISGTQWATADNKRMIENNFLFQTTKGKEIVFSKEQADLADGLR